MSSSTTDQNTASPSATASAKSGQSGDGDSQYADDARDLNALVADFIATRDDGSDGFAQARSDGDAIALIVKDLGVDYTMLTGTRLFPLLRDSYVSTQQITKAFDRELASLVAEIVKLSSFGELGNWDSTTALGAKQVDSLRRMLLAIAEDVRLVLVRLADQLHRLRQSKNSSEDERHPVALVTREIFAPLASRLGIWQIKWELEDLSFRFLEPEQYKKIAVYLAERREVREQYITDVTSLLASHMEDAGIKGSVQGRPKHIYSIWRKMQRKQLDFEQVFDVRAVRILLDNVTDCYTMLGIVHGNFRYLPGEFDDYIATPKENNYQSLHTAVVGPDKKTVEIQIRTDEMHAHAELGVAAHWTYKEGASAKPSYHKKINWLRSILEPAADEDAKSEQSDNQDFIDRFKAEIFEDRVYAVTPNGDVIDLPFGSTPLDFAYYLHTQLGHRCRGAKINGRIVPLTYTLENGDVVEIISAKEPRPSRDWLIPQLGYLISTRARSKARAWFRRQDKEHTVSQGQAILEKELKRLGVEVPHVTELARELKLDGATSLYAAVGIGDLTTVDVIRVVQRLTGPRVPEEAPVFKPKIAKGTGKGQDIQIAGVGDLLTTMASCCKPVPPDLICGYITQGRGVTIHRNDCGNMLRLQTTHPERLLEVSWTEDRPDNYPVDIVVEAYDREGLLKDITALLSTERINIAAINLLKDDESFAIKIHMTLQISGLDELSRILHKIASLPNVFAVNRQ
ncbi:MAG: bifunctional (p)ppGpp synthetase/guanosine-3',5'-bis(diphosphate) 3'-pyrophosphohydrolase [Gammaproteobacteria bacterium]